MVKIKRKIQKKDVFFIFILIIGLVMMFLPIVVNTYYNIYYDMQIDKFEKNTKSMSTKYIDKLLSNEREYNKKLCQKKMSDPFTKKEIEKMSDKELDGLKVYKKIKENNDVLCDVDIPKINENIPVYVGTGQDVLKKGAGHLIGSSLPVSGKGTHVVIAAHRGRGYQKLFKDLDKIKVGDIFYIRNIKERLKYKVVSVFIVLPNDFSKLKIEPNKEYCSLLTCTPYLSNTKRLIVRGERISTNKANFGIKRSHKYFIYLLYIIFIVVSILFIRLYIIKLYKK